MSESDMKTPSSEVDWERLDKTKFLVLGSGLFSAVTTLLYPMTIIKTRMMTLSDIPPGFRGVGSTVKAIMAQDGPRGFYRGFGTVMCGMLPIRMVYINALEASKSTAYRLGDAVSIPDPLLSGLASSLGGATASLATQVVSVPIDVVSQKQMVAGAGASLGTVPVRGQAHAPHAAAATTGVSTSSAVSASAASTSTPAHPPPTPAAAGSNPLHTPSSSTPSSSSSEAGVSKGGSTTGGGHARQGHAMSGPQSGSARISGFQVAKQIIKEEGIRGLYRGFIPSLVTFVPSSALWWGAYGSYQKVFWAVLPAEFARADAVPVQPGVLTADDFSTTTVVGVQVSSAVLAGATASLITTPLDLIKTRIQVMSSSEGTKPTFVAVLSDVLRREGLKGLLRGALPRMANAALWGTSMVTVYEFLKRTCVKSDDEP